jgi:hypothetical protein
MNPAEDMARDGQEQLLEHGWDMKFTRSKLELQQRKASRDVHLMLALMRLNCNFKQYIHDYHDIVDSRSFLKSGDLTARLASIEQRRCLGISFPRAARFSSDSDCRGKAAIIGHFNTNRRESQGPTLSSRRKATPYAVTGLAPGPGTYTPREFSSSNKAMYMDSGVGRTNSFSILTRCDLGPGSYHIAPIPSKQTYTPRLDRTINREQSAIQTIGEG